MELIEFDTKNFIEHCIITQTVNRSYIKRKKVDNRLSDKTLPTYKQSNIYTIHID
jgi:hypothetical protein